MHLQTRRHAIHLYVLIAICIIKYKLLVNICLAWWVGGGLGFEGCLLACANLAQRQLHGEKAIFNNNNNAHIHTYLFSCWGGNYYSWVMHILLWPMR